MNRLDWQNAAVFLIVAIGLLVLNFRLIQIDPILNYDDRQLISPLVNLNSISDYIKAVKLGHVFDIQPVRDFSFWLDLKAKDFFRLPSGVFHLTNVLIWIAIVFINFQTILSFRFPRWISYGALILFAFHPVFADSVSWISARKHLLSVLFISAATLIVVKQARQKKTGLNWSSVFSILILYALACFSHPINILWPVFAITYLLLNKSGKAKELEVRSARIITLILGSLIIGGICLYLNESYYTSRYLLQTGIPKYVGPEFNIVGFRLLALGRYFIQLLFPAWPAPTDAYPGSTQNIVGLCLLPLFLLTLKKYGNREAFFWMLLVFLPLVPVLTELTNIFAIDTYLLSAGLGWIMVLSCLANENQNRLENLFESARVVPRSIAVLVIVFFLGQSYTLTRSWESEIQLYEYAHKVEPTPSNTARYGLSLLQYGRFMEAYGLALRVKFWNPSQVFLPLLYSKAVYFYPNRTIDEKIKRLEENRMNAPWYSYFLASLYAAKSQYRKASDELRPHLVDPSKSILQFQNELEIIVADENWFCTRASEPGCDLLISGVKSYLKEHPYLRLSEWNDKLFLERIKILSNIKPALHQQSKNHS